MSLVELIAQADERGLAASALACLDRCVSLLGGDDEVLRPLWANLADDGDADAWGGLLDKARGQLGCGAGLVDAGDVQGAVARETAEEAALLARRMLAAAPSVRSTPDARVWADGCSVAALRIHRLLDPAAGPTADAAASVDARRHGRTDAMSPLVAAELRRQTTVLELLTEHGTGGLRRALDVSTEGRRVLRAVVSRRARNT
ncbi:hypothetical protein ACIQAC_12685 [Streptomyces sp. NPDC088387]|uniref:hypothetical protein n=1 Tax=Streptomyces sp. NPDC088387 TaxID=3365859 RepID=UPI00381E6FE3